MEQYYNTDIVNRRYKLTHKSHSHIACQKITIHNFSCGIALCKFDPYYNAIMTSHLTWVDSVVKMAQE